MSPKKNGSVGINNPKLWVYSSMLMENGVKNTRHKKTVLV
jgi:hypothetical protein